MIVTESPIGRENVPKPGAYALPSYLLLVALKRIQDARDQVAPETGEQTGART